jgi:hypothetical protein
MALAKAYFRSFEFTLEAVNANFGKGGAELVCGSRMAFFLHSVIDVIDGGTSQCMPVALCIQVSLLPKIIVPSARP